MTAKKGRKRRDDAVLFKVGNLYTVDVLDHASAEKLAENDAFMDPDQPFRMRFMGKLAAIGKTHIILECQRHLGDEGVQRIGAWKLVKSAIIAAKNHGPA